MVEKADKWLNIEKTKPPRKAPVLVLAQSLILNSAKKKRKKKRLFAQEEDHLVLHLYL